MLVHSSKKALRIITRTPSKQSRKNIFQNLSLLTILCIYMLETASFCKFVILTFMIKIQDIVVMQN